MELLQPEFGLLFWTIISLMLLIVTLAIIVSLWKRGDINHNTKLVWSIFIIAAPVIGLLSYFIFGVQKHKLSK
jgi:uncharacterized BrkB/YihY/UPF0761 family membrane protein